MLGVLSRRHADAMTADFRRYYGARPDDFGALEAADLAANLPPESASMRALHPESAWSDSDYLLWSIEYSLRAIRWSLAGGKKPEPLPRPAVAGEAADAPVADTMRAVAQALDVRLEGGEDV